MQAVVGIVMGSSSDFEVMTKPRRSSSDSASTSRSAWSRLTERPKRCLTTEQAPR